eukprot:SAG31_NODE_1801_length_7238_cov_4.423449_6_plen_95_part_00
MAAQVHFVLLSGGVTGPLVGAHNYATATTTQQNRPPDLPRGDQDGYKRFQQPAWEAMRRGPAGEECYLLVFVGLFLLSFPLLSRFHGTIREIRD